MAKKDKGNKSKDEALSGDMLKKNENLMKQLGEDESNATSVEPVKSTSSIQLKNDNQEFLGQQNTDSTVQSQSFLPKTATLGELIAKRTKLLNEIQDYSIREKTDESNSRDPDHDARLKYQLKYEVDSIARIAGLRQMELDNKLLLAAEIVQSIEILLNGKFAREASAKLTARPDLKGAKTAVITFNQSDEPLLKQIDELKKANNKKIVFKDEEALESFLEKKNKPNIDKSSKEAEAAIMLYEALDKLNQNEIAATSTQLQNFKNYVNDKNNTDIKKLFDEKKQDISKLSQRVDNIHHRRAQILEQEQKMQQNRKVFLESLDKEYEQVNTKFQTLRKSLEQNIQNENEVAALEAKRIISEQKEPPIEAKKDTEVTVKTVAKRAGRSLKKFAQNAKTKAQELGVTVKSKLVQARDTIADTSVGRGVSSMKDAIVKDDHGQPRNWKETILNQKDKLVRKITRGRQ